MLYVKLLTANPLIADPPLTPSFAEYDRLPGPRVVAGLKGNVLPPP